MEKHEYTFLKERQPGLKRAAIDLGSSGDNTLVAAVSGKRIRVYHIVLVSSGTVTVRFESGASGTALTGQMTLSTNTGFSSGFCPVGHWETEEGELLNLELSDAVAVDGWIVYGEV